MNKIISIVKDPIFYPLNIKDEDKTALLIAKIAAWAFSLLLIPASCALINYLITDKTKDSSPLKADSPILPESLPVKAPIEFNVSDEIRTHLNTLFDDDDDIYKTKYTLDNLPLHPELIQINEHRPFNANQLKNSVMKGVTNFGPCILIKVSSGNLPPQAIIIGQYDMREPNRWGQIRFANTPVPKFATDRLFINDFVSGESPHKTAVNSQIKSIKFLLSAGFNKDMNEVRWTIVPEGN